MRVRVIIDVSKPLCRGRKITWMMESMVGSLLSLKGCQIFATGVGVLCTTTKTVNYGSIARAHYQLSLDSKKRKKDG